MCNFYRPEKLLINYKGYDIKWAEELTKENTSLDGVPEDAFVVMYIAQTKNRPFKGLDILTKAIHHLNDPRIHFVFIGNYSKASKAIADNGAASNSIHFLGPLPNAAKYLVHADLFVLPSLRDGLPRVLKEAMAQEVPLIISDIPGPIELVDHKKTGLIVEPGNHTALAEAISYYNSHETERIAHGKQGKEYLVSNFSSELFVEKIIGLYKQLYDEMVTN
jgi:glycosyltransferase involved in cell wall biosynthesis